VTNPVIIGGRYRIPDSELREQFTRASGPGGQHVNKTETAVQLWFDLAGTTALTATMRANALRALASRLTSDGELVIAASEHRSRERNREAARERLVDLLDEATRPRRVRRKTRVPKSSKRKRLKHKRQHGRRKALRHKPSMDD